MDVISYDGYNMATNDKTYMTITSGATDDHHIPSVCIALEGNGAGPSHQGSGVSEDGKMFTLNTIEKHAVCYGISPFASNAMLSPNPHSGIYEATTSRTLDLNGGNPTCNQGGVLVVIENKEPVLVFKERAGKPGGARGY